MIATTEPFAFGRADRRLPPEAAAFARKYRIRNLRAVDWNKGIEFLERFCAPTPTEEVFDWCVAHLIFADSEVKGPFNPVGRQFLRDIINDANDPDCREQTFIAAVGVGKTLGVMARDIWKIIHHPCRALSIMPATKGPGGSETYVTSRFIPCLEATPATRDLMPDGQRRLFMNSKKVRLNGSHFDFAGGNSATQLGSNRCGHLNIDELDKLKGQLGNEAGARALIAERTEGVKDSQIFQGTTPTVETGQGWKCLLRSDFRRRFLPCPHCNPDYRHRDLLAAGSINDDNLKGWTTFAWSEQYCVLPDKFHHGIAIPTAYLKWDKEAKRRDDTWDKDRIIRSTRLECPHCRGQILDQHKNWMDEHGLWLPTRESHGHKGYHLSALYAPPLVRREEDPAHKSLLAGRALKYLDALEDGEGMKGFINSTLAEVDVSQEHGNNKIELNSQPLAQPDWIPLITADYHKNHPYLWFIVRKWCAFKLGPPVAITDGKPDFVADLNDPENHPIREICARLIGYSGDVSRLTHHASPAWYVLGELARFNSNDPNTGHSPIIDFLLAQKITGEKLVKLFREPEPDGAGGNTMEFRRLILREMARCSGTSVTADFRVPRGGDSELIAAGYCDRSGEYAWDELTEIINEFKIGAGLKIPARGVFIDCGFAENKNRIVLQKCHESATAFDYYDPTVKTRNPSFTDRPGAYKQLHGWNGWQAIRGKPTFQSQGSGLGHDLGKHVEDPYFGTPKGGTTVVDILEIPTALFWLRKDDLRQRRTRQLATISPHVSFFPKRYLPDGTRTAESNYRLEDYQRHSTMMIFDETKNIVRPRYGVGGAQSKRHPDHPDDCETYQVAAATHLEFFETTTDQKK